MTTRSKIDLSEMTRGEVSILVGYAYGQRARGHYKLDALDDEIEPVVVARPPELETITPSFVQGFFGRSVLKIGRDNFYRRYRFEDWPKGLLDQVDAGLELALMDRPLVSQPAHA